MFSPRRTAAPTVLQEMPTQLDHSIIEIKQCNHPAPIEAGRPGDRRRPAAASVDSGPILVWYIHRIFLPIKAALTESSPGCSNRLATAPEKGADWV